MRCLGGTYSKALLQPFALCLKELLHRHIFAVVHDNLQNERGVF